MLVTGLAGVANELPAQALRESQGQQRYDRRRLGVLHCRQAGCWVAARGESQVDCWAIVGGRVV